MNRRAVLGLLAGTVAAPSPGRAPLSRPLPAGAFRRLFADRAGFSDVSFLDGAEPQPTSGLASPLVPADAIPASFALGQTCCIVRP